MQTFANWSGQVINLNKSFLHFSNKITWDKRDQIFSILRLQLSRDDGKYLGLPLVVPRSRGQAWNDVQKTVNNQLAGLKARYLSQAGRTMLIQSVASTIPSYYMSVFLLPKNVC